MGGACWQALGPSKSIGLSLSDRRTESCKRTFHLASAFLTLLGNHHTLDQARLSSKDSKAGPGQGGEPCWIAPRLFHRVLYPFFKQPLKCTWATEKRPLPFSCQVSLAVASRVRGLADRVTEGEGRWRRRRTTLSCNLLSAGDPALKAYEQSNSNENHV